MQGSICTLPRFPAQLTKNVLDGVSDPIDRLENSLKIQNQLETLDIAEIFNDALNSYLNIIILQEIDYFFKNPFSCPNCGSKIEILIEPICVSCSEPIEINYLVKDVEFKLKKLHNLIQKFDKIPLYDSTKNMMLFVEQQLKVV